MSTKPLCKFTEITSTQRYAPENVQHIRKIPSSGRTPLGTASTCQKNLTIKSFYLHLLKEIY